MKKTETAGGVVLNKEGKVLVVSQNGNSWSLPKGHIEKDENGIEAAVREIQEESGVSQLEYLKPLGTYQRFRIGLNGKDDRSELKTIHMFLFSTDQEELKPTDPKNPEARWVPKSDVAKLLTHQKDKDFFDSILKEL